jgi:hypothetical protein
MKLIDDIVNDTLKKDGKFSRTSLTMATAWLACLVTYIWDFCVEGFRMDAFTVMVGISLGIKWVDAKSKQIEKS